MNPRLSRLSLKDLQVFEVLAETRNTIETATRLELTQSAVSQSLKRLEDILDARLMDRATRPMAITRAGEIFKRGASEIIVAAQGIESSIAAITSANTSVVRIGLVDSFATTVGPLIVKELQEQTDRLVVLSGLSPKVNGDLIERSVDFVITSDAMLHYDEFFRRRVVREPLIAVVPKSAIDRFRTCSLQQMCEALPLVRYSRRSAFGRHIDYFLRQRRLVSSSSLEFDLSESVVGMVATGIGWAITTPLCFLQARPSGLDVELIALPGVAARRELYLVHRLGVPRLAEHIYALCVEQTKTLLRTRLKEFAPELIEEVEFGELSLTEMQ